MLLLIFVVCFRCFGCLLRFCCWLRARVLWDVAIPEFSVFALLSGLVSLVCSVLVGVRGLAFWCFVLISPNLRYFGCIW